MPPVWTIEHAQDHLIELIDDATAFGPQTITREGQTLAIVVSAHEWNSILNKETEVPVHTQIENAQIWSGNLKSFICG